MEASPAPASSSPALTAEERREVDELRRQNETLRTENASLQRKLEEEKAHRVHAQQEDTHYAAEAKSCCAAIKELDRTAEVVALYEELHRLRAKCDVYADAIEESRNYFFEMKRLYTEVEPILRSSGAAHPSSPPPPA